MVMAKVFISHVEEDGNLAADLAQALEGAGVTTWNYMRDSFPGLSYLSQIATAIEDCEILVVVISNNALGSKQMTSEIVRGFESKKAFVPVLSGLTHAVFQKLQPEWRGAFGAATSIQIPQRTRTGSGRSSLDFSVAWESSGSIRRRMRRPATLRLPRTRWRKVLSPPAWPAHRRSA
jgi:hypothetical protein